MNEVRSWMYRKQIIHGSTQEYVYLIRSHHHGFTKIGVSSDVERRLEEMRCTDWTVYSLYELFTWKPYERWLHRKYIESRMAGEWFCLLPHQIESITSGEDHEEFLSTLRPDTLQYLKTQLR